MCDKLTTNYDILPLNIVGIEVPKNTVRLGKFHIQALGTSIGLMLESWSANTCIGNSPLLLPNREKCHELAKDIYHNLPH